MPFSITFFEKVNILLTFTRIDAILFSLKRKESFMIYTNRFHKNAISLIMEKYRIPTFCIHSISSEMIGRASDDTIIVISSLSDLGEGQQVLFALRHIFENNAYVLVLDNESISTAKIEKESDIKYNIVPDIDKFNSVKSIVNDMLKYLDDELSFYAIPKDFPEQYWNYELGKVKLSDAYDSLGLSKPYFYKLCEIYEKTIHFYNRQWQTSVEIIQTPKKRVMDYEKMIEILTPFVEKGLTYESLATLENELQLSWTDLWRSLLAMKKSRFYFYHLKNNPEFKKKPLYMDINNALKDLNKNPNSFIQMGSVQASKYMFPEERFTPNI
mgnify:CR=1 FL=1